MSEEEPTVQEVMQADMNEALDVAFEAYIEATAGTERTVDDAFMRGFRGGAMYILTTIHTIDHMKEGVDHTHGERE